MPQIAGMFDVVAVELTLDRGYEYEDRRAGVIARGSPPYIPSKTSGARSLPSDVPEQRPRRLQELEVGQS